MFSMKEDMMLRRRHVPVADNTDEPEESLATTGITTVKKKRWFAVVGGILAAAGLVWFAHSEFRLILYSCIPELWLWDPLTLMIGAYTLDPSCCQSDSEIRHVATDPTSEMIYYSKVMNSNLFAYNVTSGSLTTHNLTDCSLDGLVHAGGSQYLVLAYAPFGRRGTFARIATNTMQEEPFPLQGLRSASSYLMANPDSNSIVIANVQRRQVRLYNLDGTFQSQTGDLKPWYGHYQINSYAWSSEYDKKVYVMKWDVSCRGWPGLLDVYEVINKSGGPKTIRLLDRAIPFSGVEKPMATSLDGSRLLLASDGRLRVYGAKTWKPLFEKRLTVFYCWDALWLSNGGFLLLGRNTDYGKDGEDDVTIQHWSFNYHLLHSITMTNVTIFNSRIARVDDRYFVLTPGPRPPVQEFFL